MSRLLLTGLFTATIAALPAYSAERIQFFYGPFEPTLAVDDLQNLADTGELTGSLSVLSRHMSDEQIAELQVLLNLEFDIPAVMMSQLTYSTLGEQLLRRAGEIFQTDSFLNGFYALRAALLFAAEDGRLTVLDVVRHFPQETIQINLPLAVAVFEENQQLFTLRDEVLATLREQTMPQSPRPMNDLLAVSQQLGPHKWQIETLTFWVSERQDTSQFYLFRPTSTPAATQSIPVIVISHGVAASVWSLAYLAEHLASHGYAVILLEHPETTPQRFSQFFSGLAGPPSAMTLLNRPRDITAALDTLTQQAQRNPDLQKLNLESVGVLGHSLGGYTALAVAGADVNATQITETCQGNTVAQRPSLNLSMLIQCRFAEIPSDASFEVQDERVEAVIALNPFTSKVFGEAGLGAIDVPVMLVSSLDDYFVPALPEQIEPYDWLQSRNRYLVLIENATHFSLLERGADGALPVPDFLIGPSSETIHQQMATLSLAFFERHLQQQATAEAYLNQSYLSQFVDEPYRFDIFSGALPYSLFPDS
ncbi:MAG: alpha/beta fold hydrolase [Cyanobacteria bacterium P01_G01_bin.38]